MSSLDHFAARINAWEREHGRVNHAARARYHSAHTPQLAGGFWPFTAWGGDKGTQKTETKEEDLKSQYTKGQEPNGKKLVHPNPKALLAWLEERVKDIDEKDYFRRQRESAWDQWLDEFVKYDDRIKKLETWVDTFRKYDARIHRLEEKAFPDE